MSAVRKLSLLISASAIVCVLTGCQATHPTKQSVSGTWRNEADSASIVLRPDGTCRVEDVATASLVAEPEGLPEHFGGDCTWKLGDFVSAPQQTQESKLSLTMNESADAPVYGISVSIQPDQKSIYWVVGDPDDDKRYSFRRN